MLCSKLHRTKAFKWKVFTYKINLGKRALGALLTEANGQADDRADVAPGPGERCQPPPALRGGANRLFQLP